MARGVDGEFVQHAVPLPKRLIEAADLAAPRQQSWLGYPWRQEGRLPAGFDPVATGQNGTARDQTGQTEIKQYP